jgi:hypothetical protein
MSYNKYFTFIIILIIFKSHSQDFDIFEKMDEIRTEIKTDSIKKVREENKKLANWYSGSASIILGLDSNIPVGVKVASANFYLDIKSNFGLWSKDKPDDYDRAFDDLNWIRNDMGATLKDSSTDDSSAVTILNLGISLPIIKRKKITTSIFAGIGFLFNAKKTYHRYTTQYSNENYYYTSKEMENKFNINIGFEIAPKNSPVITFGYDTAQSSASLGLGIIIY